jgi:hypothetical protein
VLATQTTPLDITDETFDNTTYFNATLYVPTGSSQLYKQAAGWKNFFDIKEKDFPSNISTVITQSKKTVNDLTGHILYSPTKGVNIIRKSDGKTKKVIFK